MENDTILIVDDDPVARTLIGRLLEARGYVVHTAEDAYSAVVAARASTPDAIVLDFRLPGGDALVVIERIRRLPKLGSTPIVVVSAVDPTLHAAEVKQAGAASFVHKPFEPDELLTELARALREERAPVSDGSVLRAPA